ncbi:hypothetical protein [Fictibacillus phosphorivorans]|uniref:hypothetical protein n=1 Tax=Fictibacillus phosphorivorans TaxID=1221500 RepID=UPI001292E0A2|nr:hypothetical protein [Fictibacillus phosphorivorans]MQR94776.1 hypothetical protein [Fictibacillus phosphorivorans]
MKKIYKRHLIKRNIILIALTTVFILTMVLNSFGGFLSIPLLITSILIYTGMSKLPKISNYVSVLYIIFIRFLFGLVSLQILLYQNAPLLDKIYINNNLILLLFYSFIVALFLHMFISFLRYMYIKVYSPEIKSKKIHSTILIFCLIATLIGTDLTFGMLYSFIATVYGIKGVNYLDSFYFSFSLHYSLPIADTLPVSAILSKKFDSSFIVEITNITFIYTSKMIDLLFLAVFADVFLDIFKRTKRKDMKVT